MNSLQKITAKELAQKMGISIKTAEKYLKDVKEQYDIKVVCLGHVNTYFKVNAKT
jgi:ribosomal protein S25